MKRFLALLVLTLEIACVRRSTFANDVYRDRETSFRVGDLPRLWHRQSMRDVDLAFTHAEGGTIFANAECTGGENVPLVVSTNHLLLDLDVVRRVSETELTIDGRMGLRTHFIAQLEGVPVELDLVVTSKGGCTYDLGLIAGFDTFEERRGDFDRFVACFTTEARAC